MHTQDPETVHTYMLAACNRQHLTAGKMQTSNPQSIWMSATNCSIQLVFQYLSLWPSAVVQKQHIQEQRPHSNCNTL